MDKLKAMTVFVGIVEAGSLTAAAERAGSSLASVVRQLAALEHTLGVRLINRTTRRMALTDEGRAYFERCRRLLADIDDMEHALTDREQAPAGRLLITAPVMFGRLHVAPIVSDFLAAFPGMRAELILLDRVVDLLDEGFDLAVRIGSLPDSSLVAARLGETRRVLCASPGYLQRHGVPTVPGDLAAQRGQHQMVGFARFGAMGEWVFQQNNQRERIALQERFATNQVPVALDACLKGLGIGRFLGYQVADALADGRLVSVLDDWMPPPEPVHLLMPSGRLMSSRVRSFVNWASPHLRAAISAHNAGPATAD